jgi:hypothetical protein
VTSADPLVSSFIDAQSWNGYSYVANTPLNATDPSGWDAYTLPPVNVVGGGGGGGGGSGAGYGSSYGYSYGYGDWGWTWDWTWDWTWSWIYSYSYSYYAYGGGAYVGFDVPIVGTVPISFTYAAPGISVVDNPDVLSGMSAGKSWPDPTEFNAPSRPAQPAGAGYAENSGAYGYVSGGLHTALTAGSFLPSVFGSTFALLDSGLYAAEGDYGTAAISLVAAGAGVFADAGVAKVALLGGSKLAAAGLGVAAKGLRRAPEFAGGKISQSGFLAAAEKWLGTGYKSLPNGRYVSADGLRQVRYGRHETSSQLHHGHFEAYDVPGGRVVENTWVKITP